MVLVVDTEPGGIIGGMPGGRTLAGTAGALTLDAEVARRRRFGLR